MLSACLNERLPSIRLVADRTVMGDRVANLAAGLIDRLSELNGCVVAFSGGVDSAVVAAAAYRALGPQAVAVTAVSPSLASGELEHARAIAEQIGITHEVIQTDELSRDRYVRNAGDRCYACKSELYEVLESWLEQHPITTVLNGANLDDAGDYRPGMRAARKHRVLSPLLELKLGKSDVREVARYWQLEVWDKPASPCLASRIAYGEEVTREKLEMIDAAEAFLKQRGFREFRVRYHADALARIELLPGDLTEVMETGLYREICERLTGLGFRFVTLDLQGFRSGSLVPVEWIENMSQEGPPQ